MKTLPALIAGLAFAALFYGTLRAADPGVLRDNPWVLHFREGGFTTRLRSTSDAVQHRIAVAEWRPKLDDPRFAARLSSLVADDVPIQVVEFASPEVAGEVEKLKFRERPFKVAREGRRLCIIIPVQGRVARSELRERITDHFRRLAETLP